MKKTKGGYDGYYDDIKPDDFDQIAEGVSPATVKQIVVIAVGAVLLIIAATVLMFLL